MRVILTSVKRSTERTWQDASGRLRRAETLGARVLAALLVLLLSVFTIVVVLPLLILVMLVGAVLGLCLWLWLRIRMAFARSRMPNGAFDGRKNVRVVQRGSGEG